MKARAFSRCLTGLACLAALAACGGTSPEGAAGAPAASVSAASPPAVITAAASASASASAPAGAVGEGPLVEGGPEAGTYEGAYKAKVGSVNEVKEKEGKPKAWSTDPGTEAVGDGTLSLVVTGRRAVKGQAKGALGEQELNGELEGKALRARVDPSDPNAPAAMTGILTGTFEGSGFKGVLRVAGRNGNVVREAAVTLTRK